MRQPSASPAGLPITPIYSDVRGQVEGADGFTPPGDGGCLSRSGVGVIIHTSVRAALSASHDDVMPPGSLGPVLDCQMTRGRA